MDSSTQVTDSTDWLGTSLACLAPVEQAFRCHVCKDFYTSPMITSCNHTFCSLCIRRCLSSDGKCPLCRMADQESKLRGNWSLREAIEAFCLVRTTILEVARRPAAASKRKADDTVAEVVHESEDSDAPQPKRTRTSARLSKTKAAEAVATMAQNEVMEIRLPRRDGNGDGDYEPDDGLAACPICWTRMKPWQVDRHIDTSCTGSPQKPKATTASTAPTTAALRRTNPFSATAAPAAPPDRIPSLSYSLLTDTALRKKLASLGLSTAGTRQLLERRHREWTTIWNANCDSAQPKRKADLQHDLDVWERTIGSSIGGGTGSRGAVWPSRSVAMASQQVAQIRDKNFDGAEWASRHSTSFQDLIANARKSKSKAETRTETDKAEATTEAAAIEQEPAGEATAELEERG